MALIERKITSGETIFDRFPELKAIPKDKFPKNVFIIPDGNGRWAEQRGLPVYIGHQKGADVIAQAFKDFNDLGEQIPFIGVWGFSVDNLKRPPMEVEFLMDLFNKEMQKFRGELIERNNRFIHIGRKDILSLPLVQSLEEVEKTTKSNTGQTVYIALGFGGTDQTRRMIKKAVGLVEGNVDLVTDELVDSLRDGNGQIPPADLIIRSSGEQRYSDIGWINGAGTEFYPEMKLFPDTTTKDLVRAIVHFSMRDRRFGGRPQK